MTEAERLNYLVYEHKHFKHFTFNMSTYLARRKHRWASGWSQGEVPRIS